MSDQIKKDLNNLSLDNQLIFGLSCIQRVKELYSLFSDNIKKEDSEYMQKYKSGVFILNTIYDELKSNLVNKLSLSKSIDEYESECENLAPSYEEESTYQSTIAVNICLLFSNLFQYYNNPNDKVLLSEFNVYMNEIINILGSQIFYTTNPDGDYEECEIYLEKYFDREFQIELDIINLIKNDISFEELEAYNQKYLINNDYFD